MSWEQRLRDMVLAGGAGALAAIGCADSSGAGVDSGSVDFCCNANADPCCRSQSCGAPVTTECTVKMACESDGGTWDYGTQGCGHPQDGGMSDAPVDAQPDVVLGFCCNANADPCCPSLYCGAPVITECTVKMACESDGGTWDYGTQGCGHPADAGQPRDAGPTDAGPTDAQPDVIVDPFCCNANIDPCCPSIYCGKTVTPECTDKMACESSGGMWDYPGCLRDAGTRDATSDAP